MDYVLLNLNKTSPDLPTENEIRFQIGLLAGVAAVAVGLIVRFGFDAPLVPELLAQFIFAIAPIWTVELAVGMLGPFAKHLAFLACTVLYLIALIAAVIAYLRWVPLSKLPRRIWTLGFVGLTWAVTVGVLIPLTGGGFFGSNLRQGALLVCAWMLVVHIVYGLALRVMVAKYVDQAESSSAPGRVIGRRRVVRGVGYAVLGVGLYDIGKSLFGMWLQSGSGRVKRGDGVFPNIDNLALEITPTGDFYQVSKNAFDPQVDVRRWKLEITGLVNSPVSLSYDQLKALPSVDQFATLACISNEVGGDLIGTASWRGVRLKDVLAQAELKRYVVDILLRASDDYSDSISLDRAMSDGTLLVYEMNGAPLTSEHGFPVRLLVPGIYGMKNVKWITRIEAVGFDFKGYWQRRGWDDRAEYKTMSRIDAPAHSVKSEATIAGIAFAGDRGVSKVEVSTDGGRTWEQAVIKPALSPFCWVLWSKAWAPAQAGKYRVFVRATDDAGITQTSQPAPPEPSGSSGYHSVIINTD